MTKTCIAALLFAVTLLVAYYEVDAICCKKPGRGCSKFDNLCNDCSSATPYCAYGACNIFGCNCDGGCRRGVGWSNCKCPKPPMFRQFNNMPSIPKKCISKQARQREARESEAHLDLLFERADQNGDALLDLKEAQEWARQYHPMALARRPLNVEQEFQKLDRDHDGYISREEIDP